MKINHIVEARWIKVTGGANSLAPNYSYPWSHPHEVHTEPMLWYHGTSDVYLDSIKSNGLNNLLSPKDLRTRVDNAPWLSPQDSRRALLSQQHMTQELDLAETIARRNAAKTGGKPIIVVIDSSKLTTDLYGTETDSHTETVVPEAIVDIRYI